MFAKIVGVGDAAAAAAAVMATRCCS